MNQSHCSEMLLDDIVSLSFYPADCCLLPIPVAIPATVLPSFAANTEAVFTASLAESSDCAKMDAPTLKLATTAKPEGRIVAHDLAIPIIYTSRWLAEQAQCELAGRDFHIVYTHGDGHRSVSLSLPNSSSIELEENQASASSCTLKVKFSSMSLLLSVEDTVL